MRILLLKQELLAVAFDAEEAVAGPFYFFAHGQTFFGCFFDFTPVLGIAFFGPAAMLALGGYLLAGLGLRREALAVVLG